MITPLKLFLNWPPGAIPPCPPADISFEFPRTWRLCSCWRECRQRECCCQSWARWHPRYPRSGTDQRLRRCTSSRESEHRKSKWRSWRSWTNLSFVSSAWWLPEYLLRNQRRPRILFFRKIAWSHQAKGWIRSGGRSLPVIFILRNLSKQLLTTRRPYWSSIWCSSCSR